MRFVVIMGQHYPVIILGAGPAGVSAALAFKEAEIEALVLEQQPACGGQLTAIPSAISNFALGWFSNGAEAQLRLQAVVAKSTVNIRQAQVLKVEIGGDSFPLVNQAWSCNYLLVATGLSENRLALPPTPINEMVRYHIDENLQGKTLAIVGGGDSALLKAIKLSREARKIFVIHRREKFNARPDLIAEVATLNNVETLMLSEIKQLAGTDKVESITVATQAAMVNLKVDFVLAKIGYVPNSAAVGDLLALDQRGYIIVDNQFKTSQQRIFAAGDITAGTVPRIGTAVGQGMACAAGVITLINNELSFSQ